jgi:hypothetical protein
MNKAIIIGLVLIMSACAQLQHGQQQPVVLRSAKEKIYFTSCTGGAEDWGICHNKARATCSGDYITINRYEAIKATVIRELTFQCKK